MTNVHALARHAALVLALGTTLTAGAPPAGADGDRTPGRSRARLASIDTRRACAWGERRTAACSIPGTLTSSTNRPRPLTRRSPPSRG